MDYKSIQKALMLKKLAALFFSFLLVACGGGGGGSSSGSGVVASTLAFPLRQININQLENSSSAPFTVSGTYNGYSVTGSGNITDSRLMRDATFEGKSALKQTSTITGSITVNGQTAPLSSSDTTYVDPNYVLLGNSGNYYIVYADYSIPTSVYVNDTGTLVTGKKYASSINKTLLGTLTVTYVVEADTATTALVSIIFTDKDSYGTVTETQTNQYRITADGTSARVKFTIWTNTSTSKGTLVLSF